MYFREYIQNIRMVTETESKMTYGNKGRERRKEDRYEKGFA